MIDRYIHTVTGGVHSVRDLTAKTPDGTPIAIKHYAGHEAHERAATKTASLNSEDYRNKLRRVLWHVENTEGCTDFDDLVMTLNDIRTIVEGKV